MALSMDERGIIVSCGSCTRKNRVAFGRTAYCAVCKKPLPPPREPIEVPSAAAFEALVTSSTVPVIVDFWAPWCGPCRMVAPEVERVAAGSPGRYLVAKVNTEALPDLGARYRVQSIPTMAVFDGGREVARTLGARPAAQIEAFVQQALAQRKGA